MMPLGTVPFGPFVKNEPNGTVPNGITEIISAPTNQLHESGPSGMRHDL